MSDTDAAIPPAQPTPSTPPEPSPAEATAATPELPPKKPKLIRPAGIILLVLLILGGWLSIPYVVEPWLLTKIEDTIAANGLEVGEDTQWDLDLLAGHLSAKPLSLRETWKGETHTVLAAEEMQVDIGLGDLLGGDVIIDALVAKGVTGDFRRRGDGSVPLMTPDPESNEPEPEGGWGSVDWFGYAKKAYSWWDERQKEAEEAQKADPSQEAKLPPKAKQDPSWEGSRRYEPELPPGRGPRFMIRRLEVSGAGLKLPDDSPFEVTGFTLNGSNVCIIQMPDEHMQIQAELTTSGTGPVTLLIERKPGADGELSLKATEVPVEAIADPNISGDTLAPYQPKGSTTLDLHATWSEGILNGLIDSTVSQFDFTPPAGNTSANQFHQVISRLDGRPLRWPVKIGGSLGSPRITDSGIDDLIKGSLKDAVTDAAKAEATKRAQEEAAKQLEKNPELKKATEQATEKVGAPLKNLFGK